jgi:uncharacterized membrane protein
MISATHLHAMIIHFPIALLMAGFLSEIVAFFIKQDFFKRAAVYLLLFGALGATISYITGSYAGAGIEQGPLKTPMELHQQAATITLWLAIILALLRTLVYYFKYNPAWVKWIGILLFAVLIGAVSRTGYLGGQLVYNHGAGVQIELPGFGDTGNRK